MSIIICFVCLFVCCCRVPPHKPYRNIHGLNTNKCHPTSCCTCSSLHNCTVIPDPGNEWGCPIKRSLSTLSEQHDCVLYNFCLWTSLNDTRYHWWGSNWGRSGRRRRRSRRWTGTTLVSRTIKCLRHYTDVLSLQIQSQGEWFRQSDDS